MELHDEVGDWHTGDILDGNDLRRLVQTTMSRYVSVVRDANGLREAISILTSALEAMPAGSFRKDDWTLGNMALSSLAIACAGLNRQESRGAHFRSDFPDTNPELDGVHFSLVARPGEDDLWIAGSLDAARAQATA